MKCFVIMPFGNPAVDPVRANQLDHVYKEWIKPTVEAVKVPKLANQCLVCHRVDKETRCGSIITDIIENLATADVVIADLSGKNPNVFYELGVRHAVRNNTTLIADTIDDIPFDLKILRIIPYKYDPEHLVNFRNTLAQTIENILEGDQRIDNPVREFLYNREREKLLTSATPPGYDAVKTMISEFTSMKAALTKEIGDLRHMVQEVTSPRDATETRQEQGDFKMFEGVWRFSPSGGLMCARVVNGELLAAYCYDGEDWLTGHFHSFRRFGDALFARFEWFRKPISGYGHYRIISEDKLVGGWWFGEDVPEEAMRDPARMREIVPQMEQSAFVRDKKRKKFPKWAEEYFARAATENPAPRRPD